MSDPVFIVIAIIMVIIELRWLNRDIWKNWWNPLDWRR